MKWDWSDSNNNKNQIFSIDTNVGNFNWQNKVNSNIRPSVIENLLFTVSLEGYLVVLEKKSGNILFDNIEIESLTIDSLRSKIGLVSQDVFLFEGTVFENIALG